MLRFGIDPTATDGYDPVFGESPLPPLPPASGFDVRFIGADIGIPALEDGTLRDYRQGTIEAGGTKTYELQYQVGSGTVINILWNLPIGVSGTLKDIILGSIINVPMDGSGSYEVIHPGEFDRLKMTIQYGTPTGVHEESKFPAFTLYQNYPNPFNPTTVIEFHLPRASHVILEVLNISGQQVKQLVNGQYEAGSQQVEFDATGLATGMYFYRVEAGYFVSVRKLMLAK